MPEGFLKEGKGVFLVEGAALADAGGITLRGEKDDNDPYEYRRKLAWRGRFANLPRTVNYYSPTDNVLANPAGDDPDDYDAKAEAFWVIARGPSPVHPSPRSIARSPGKGDDLNRLMVAAHLTATF